MSSELMNKVAVEVAHQNAMERGCKFLPHGSRLFTVEQGWESAIISKDKGVAVADTLLTLEAALRNPENKVIFIPLDAAMTEGDIEKLCQRNAITKTLFKEVKKSS
ncbi:MAG: hypothetical protein K8R48_05865 [Alphaproteobacteria bacterium]|nr:hypothetical protein [Alphaproteobacteria bacterium]